jgi:hypothetical protein
LLPLTRIAPFGFEVLDAAEPVAVSEAWWTSKNISVYATPMSELASEGAFEIVSVNTGVVPVIVPMAAVIVWVPTVHVPYTLPTSLVGIKALQPLVGVKTELGNVE